MLVAPPMGVARPLKAPTEARPLLGSMLLAAPAAPWGAAELVKGFASS